MHIDPKIIEVAVEAMKRSDTDRDLPDIRVEYQTVRTVLDEQMPAGSAGEIAAALRDVFRFLGAESTKEPVMVQGEYRVVWAPRPYSFPERSKIDADKLAALVGYAVSALAVGMDPSVLHQIGEKAREDEYVFKAVGNDVPAQLGDMLDHFLGLPKLT
ncbi:hypothetical protein [Pseudooceanicola nitratireducens]|uniref:hypothetical protein n=1 Tax=Pseudooceanicola nitratireducens TaxID=517719 RepID=UPI003C79C743